MAQAAALCAGSLFEVTKPAVQRAVAESVGPRVQRSVDRGQAGVAVEVGAELIAERWEPCKAQNSGAAVPEQSLHVVAQRGPRYLTPAVLQESCPGSTKGRPGSHS